jgi:hypothetical protein
MVMWSDEYSVEKGGENRTNRSSVFRHRNRVQK